KPHFPAEGPFRVRSRILCPAPAHCAASDFRSTKARVSRRIQLSPGRRLIRTRTDYEPASSDVGAFRKSAHHPATDLHVNVSAGRRARPSVRRMAPLPLDRTTTHYFAHVCLYLLGFTGMVTTRLGI